MSVTELLSTFKKDGKEFESLTKWFLENDPTYAGMLKNVWLWNDWPDRYGPDCGIDLVAETTYGSLWAIQAKHYDENYYVTKEDVNSFLAESGRPMFSYRLLVTTTDKMGPNAVRTMDAQEKKCGVVRRLDLEKSKLDFSKFKTVQTKPAKPAAQVARPHQVEAIENIFNGFQEYDRGQCIMACGTGKSFVALKVSEAFNTTLVLVPSIALVKQFRSYWLANTTVPVKTLCVCSDDTVAEDDDEIRVLDLGVPVTTNTAEIAAFLRKPGKKVVFSTYQSSPMLDDPAIKFDLTIADEAHRCAGGRPSLFNVNLDGQRLRSTKRLFLTATPRYVEGDTAVTMEDPALFGPVFHSLSFGQAIKKKLLCDYEVIVSVIREPMYQDWVDTGRFVTYDGSSITDARTMAAHITLAHTMKTQGLKRVITFHSRVKKAKAFAENMADIIDWLPESMSPAGNLQAHYVDASMSASERTKKLRSFATHDGPSMLCNVRVLGEGVDVPEIDTVAFIDPKASMVDIIQAVGRAIRLSPNKTHGRIFIAAVIPEGMEAGEALEDDAFSIVWDVLEALRAHDETLAERLTLGTGTGARNGVGRPRILDRVVVVGAEPINHSFAKAFESRILNDPAIMDLDPVITQAMTPPTDDERRAAMLSGQARNLVRLMQALGSTIETDPGYTQRLELLTSSINRTCGIDGDLDGLTLDELESRGAVIRQKLERYGVVSS